MLSHILGGSISDISVPNNQNKKIFYCSCVFWISHAWSLIYTKIDHFPKVVSARGTFIVFIVSVYKIQTEINAGISNMNYLFIGLGLAMKPTALLSFLELSWLLFVYAIEEKRWQQVSGIWVWFVIFQVWIDSLGTVWVNTRIWDKSTRG